MSDNTWPRDQYSGPGGGQYTGPGGGMYTGPGGGAYTGPGGGMYRGPGGGMRVAQKIRDVAENLRLKRSTTRSDFYNTVLRRFFGIGLHIEFNDKALSDLSMGERAIILLKVLLALDDKPLLIDQPEEHLDNRYIYYELVPAFRDAKARRQIIIATHNANLVVNTDAEQIVIAQNIDGKLSYRIGTLEDMNLREGITTILEGGNEAFKKREQKYGYKF